MSIQPSIIPKIAPQILAIKSKNSVVRVSVIIDCSSSILEPMVMVIIREETDPVRLTRLLEKQRVQSKKIVKLIVQYIMKCTILSR